MRFDGGIEPLKRGCSRKARPSSSAVSPASETTIKSGFKFTIASSEANPPKATPSSPAALNSPVSVSNELSRLSLPDTQPRRDSGSTR